jgi:hypothetical protein
VNLDKAAKGIKVWWIHKSCRDKKVANEPSGLTLEGDVMTCKGGISFNKQNPSEFLEYKGYKRVLSMVAQAQLAIRINP